MQQSPSGVRCPHCSNVIPLGSSNGGPSPQPVAMPPPSPLPPPQVHHPQVVAAPMRQRPLAQEPQLPLGQLWRGRPSHIANTGVYLWCLLIVSAKVALYQVLIAPWVGHLPHAHLVVRGLGVLPLGYALYRAVELSCRRYVLMNNGNVQLETSAGIFTQHIERQELFLSNKFTIERRFFYRLWWWKDFGDIVLHFGDADDFRNTVALLAIQDSQKLTSRLYQLTAKIREIRVLVRPH